MVELTLWVEKWRPQKLEDMVLNEEAKEFFQQCFDTGEIPNLLLNGPPGTGKTTIAKILARELNAEVLMLNASDERGVDTIREKVKNFLMSETGARWQIVFFDEADYLTNVAQATLRNMMETFSRRGRFIFSVNYMEKVIGPIISRCQTVDFKEVTDKDQYLLLKRVLDSEQIKYSDDDLFKIVDDCHGDLRKVINESQRMSLKGVLKYTSIKDVVDVKELISLAKEKSWGELRKKIEEGVDATYILRKLFDYVFEEVSPEVAARVLGDYMWKDSITFDRPLNLFCALIELSKYLV